MTLFQKYEVSYLEKQNVVWVCVETIACRYHKYLSVVTYKIVAHSLSFSLDRSSKKKLEEGLFWFFETNREYISVDVDMSKVKTLEYLIKWSWITRLVVFSWLFSIINFHPFGRALITSSHWK